VVLDENKKPMFNRAISGVYPPGSIYKLLTATAALEEGEIDKNTLIEDTGEIKVGVYRYGNWYFDKYGRKDGMINIEKALGRSNDIFFYKAGEKVGIDKLVSWSAKFGLGKKTGIDLPSEASGLLPTPLWMEKTNGQRWFLGNTYHMAIGQGDLLTTPLQMNRLTAAAVSGDWCKPQIVNREQGTECRAIGVSEENRKIIMNGMRMVCEEGGTAYTFFDMKGKVLCKTGTAQHGGEDTKPHAWITVVVDDVVVTVLLEAAGEGSVEAGPVARKIVNYILEKY
jgi:penicillin-binding protein 2